MGRADASRFCHRRNHATVAAYPGPGKGLFPWAQSTWGEPLASDARGGVARCVQRPSAATVMGADVWRNGGERTRVGRANAGAVAGRCGGAGRRQLWDFRLRLRGPAEPAADDLAADPGTCPKDLGEQVGGRHGPEGGLAAQLVGLQGAPAVARGSIREGETDCVCQSVSPRRAAVFVDDAGSVCRGDSGDLQASLERDQRQRWRRGSPPPAGRSESEPRHHFRVETDLRSLKRTVGLHQLSSKSPDMVEKELLLAVAAYNLVRAVMCLVARRANLTPRQLSFSFVQTVVEAALPGLDHAATE